MAPKCAACIGGVAMGLCKTCFQIAESRYENVQQAVCAIPMLDSSDYECLQNATGGTFSCPGR